MTSTFSELELPDGIKISQDEAIATIQIHNPANRNSVDDQSVAGLARALEAANEDPSVRSLILTGDDKAFSSGADLARITGAGAQKDAEGVFPFMREVEKIILSITRGGLPVISAIEGSAAGVGAAIALACDIIVAADNAFFLLPFSSVALVPDGGVAASLVAGLGRARTMDLALRARRLPAREAYDAGAVTEVVEPGAAYRRAQDIAIELAALDADATAATKGAVNSLALPGLEEALAEESRIQSKLLTEPNFYEGVRAFMEQRRPNFR